MQAPKPDNPPHQNTETCRFCGSNAPQPVLHATERMFGWGGDFRYSRCLDCGSLRLLNVPEDLGKYYPQDYYAYQVTRYEPMSGIAAAVKKLLCRHYYQSFNPLMTPLSLFFPKWLKWLPRALVRFDQPILDVGCGGGQTLAMLAHEGFTDLTGVDPFLKEDSDHQEFRLLKRELADHQGSYELVYALHVFEHVRDPLEFLVHARRLLTDSGTLLIAMPNPASLAFHLYKQFWFALDAPRHLALYSPPAFEKMASTAGLEVYRSYSDSTISQFVGSDQYLRGKTMSEFHGFRGPRHSLARLMTAALNLTGYGDSRCYFLRKSQA